MVGSADAFPPWCRTAAFDKGDDAARRAYFRRKIELMLVSSLAAQSKAEGSGVVLSRTMDIRTGDRDVMQPQNTQMFTCS
jgi:hypothetical protein